MDKKKILITGSNGLLGQKLVYALRNRNDVEVIATSKGENRINEKRGYIYESLDITVLSEVEAILNKYMPHTIINTAAMTNVDACETDQKSCWALNVTAVENIVKTLEKFQIESPHTQLLNYYPHIIHLSTDFVFDGESGSYKEDDLPNPISYYGLSKCVSEKWLQSSILKGTIIRTIIVYGIADNMSRSNIVLWAKDALEKGQKINVVDDQFRSPTLAEDLADGCIRVAMKEATGIYHISGKETMSILELVHKVADFYGLDKSLVKPVKSATLNQPAKRPPRTGFIIDKAIRELDYHPHSFIEGLEILTSQLNSCRGVTNN